MEGGCLHSLVGHSGLLLVLNCCFQYTVHLDRNAGSFPTCMLDCNIGTFTDIYFMCIYIYIYIYIYPIPV